MRVVRLPGSSALDTSSTGGAVKALQLFSEHILQHRLVQRQLRHQLLEPCVLVAQLLDLTDLIYL